MINAGVSPLHPTKTFLERQVLDSKELEKGIYVLGKAFKGYVGGTSVKKSPHILLLVQGGKCLFA